MLLSFLRVEDLRKNVYVPVRQLQTVTGHGKFTPLVRLRRFQKDRQGCAF